MQVRLNGKVAVVTGASRGIGASIVRRFVESGARVMLVARKRDGLERLAESLPNGTAEIFPAHAGNLQDACDCIAATMRAFGGLDILVNNAATNPYFGPAMGIDAGQFDKTIEVNQRAPLIWTQQAWRQSFADGEGGVVLNIASAAAAADRGPDDIASAAVFLVSDAASWLTGQTIVIDGGACLRPLSG